MERNRIKPRCKLSNQDGNIYNLLSIASVTLKNIGLDQEAKEMWEQAANANSYDEALAIIQEYVEVY